MYKCKLYAQATLGKPTGGSFPPEQCKPGMSKTACGEVQFSMLDNLQVGGEGKKQPNGTLNVRLVIVFMKVHHQNVAKLTASALPQDFVRL